MAKVCVACGSDVSKKRRVKDAESNYYCETCWQVQQSLAADDTAYAVPAPTSRSAPTSMKAGSVRQPQPPPDHLGPAIDLEEEEATAEEKARKPVGWFQQKKDEEWLDQHHPGWRTKQKVLMYLAILPAGIAFLSLCALGWFCTGFVAFIVVFGVSFAVLGFIFRVPSAPKRPTGGFKCANCGEIMAPVVVGEQGTGQIITSARTRREVVNVTDPYYKPLARMEVPVTESQSHERVIRLCECPHCNYQWHRAAVIPV